MNLQEAGRVHFIGIGGVGMSAIAKVMIEKGISVSGSDLKKSRAASVLAAMGVEVHIGHDASHVEGAGAVVISMVMFWTRETFSEPIVMEKVPSPVPRRITSACPPLLSLVAIARSSRLSASKSPTASHKGRRASWTSAARSSTTCRTPSPRRRGPSRVWCSSC